MHWLEAVLTPTAGSPIASRMPGQLYLVGVFAPRKVVMSMIGHCPTVGAPDQPSTSLPAPSGLLSAQSGVKDLTAFHDDVGLLLSCPDVAVAGVAARLQMLLQGTGMMEGGSCGALR